MSQVSVLLKLLNEASFKQCHTIAPGLYLSDAENFGKIQLGHQWRHQMQMG